jgi:hypothetical protein
MRQKGYFDAAAAGLRIGDALVQSPSPGDLKQVEASVPRLAGFLRQLTHPEALQALKAIILGYGCKANRRRRSRPSPLYSTQHVYSP